MLHLNANCEVCIHKGDGATSLIRGKVFFRGDLLHFYFVLDRTRLRSLTRLSTSARSKDDKAGLASISRPAGRPWAESSFIPRLRPNRVLF